MFTRSLSCVVLLAYFISLSTSLDAQCAPKLRVRAICNDNGTPCDPTDDFYSVNAYMFLSGNPGSWEVEINGVWYGPWNYDTRFAFLGNFPADGSILCLNFRDVSDPTCVGTYCTEPLIPCSKLPVVQSIVGICNDNGTANDPTDDYYEYCVVVSTDDPFYTGPFYIDVNGVSYGPFIYGQVAKFNIPADGRTHTWVTTDDFDSYCTVMGSLGPLTPCSIPCYVIPIVDVECFDNDTPDPADDFYKVRFSATAAVSGSTGKYKIESPLVPSKQYVYGQQYELDFSADGQFLYLIFTDVDYSDCFSDLILGPFEPCSRPCGTLVDYFKYSCDDNQTTDRVDDYYNFVLVMDSTNVEPGDSFILNIGTTVMGPYTYGDTIRWTMPADGMTYTIDIKDKDRPDFCFDEVLAGPLNDCSSTCALEHIVDKIRCNDAATGKDPSDDTYTFDLIVFGTDASSSWIADDISLTSANYGQRVTMGPFPISGGDITLVIKDVVDTFCQTVVLVAAPLPCSDSCFIDQVDFTVGACDDNNTGPDPSDDFFSVDIVVQGVNLGLSNSYTVAFGNAIWGPFMYGDNVTIEPLPSTGANIVLVIMDELNDHCFREITVKQDPCSDCIETANAGPTQTLTCARDQVQLSGSASSNGKFEWSGPGGFAFIGAFPIVNEAGMYILTVAFDNECVAMDTVWIDQDSSLPLALVALPDSLTCLVNEVTLDGSASTQGNDYKYVWRDEAGNIIGTDLTVPVNLAGRYCLQVLDTVLNCHSPLTCVIVDENKRVPSATILVDPDDLLNCRVDSIRLTALHSKHAVFHWEINKIIFNYDTLWMVDTGMVFLIAVDTITGCSTIVDIEINSLIEYPLVLITEPDTLTCDRTSVRIDATRSQGGPSISFQWFDDMFNAIIGEENNYLDVYDPGIYFIQSTDSITGCINIDTVEILENKVFPLADAGLPKTLRCDSDTITLDGSSSSNGTTSLFYWRGLSGVVLNNADTNMPLVEGIGLYEITVKDRVSGCESKDTVYVDRSSPPEIDGVSVQNELCEDESNGSIEITDILGGSPPFSMYLDGDEITNSVIEDLGPGQYNIKIVDSKGCDVDTVIRIKAGMNVSSNIIGDINIVEGDTTILTAESSIDSGDIQIIYWEENGNLICNDCFSIKVSPDTTTTYTLIIVDKNGCETISMVTILIKDINRLFVPNVFTPDGNKTNDNFRLFGKNLVLIRKLIIFDRWGNFLYEGNDLNPKDGWDGSFKGSPMNPAVFVYYAEAVFKDGEVREVSGDVTLMR